jgi:hypothetical protein
VTKLSASGSVIQVSTYLGGSNDYDEGTAIAYSAFTNHLVSVQNRTPLYRMVVTGVTFSANFPNNQICQPGYKGNGDEFFAVFDAVSGYINIGPTGNVSLIGSSGNDAAKAVVASPDGNFIFVGETDGADFPVSAGAGSSNATGYKATIVSYNFYSGNRFSMTYGGVNDISDTSAYAVAITPEDVILFAGRTTSATLPSSGSLNGGSYQGGGDGYLAAICLSITNLPICHRRYLGGSGDDAILGLRLASDGTQGYQALALDGSTTSANFPVIRAIFPVRNGSQQDGFYASGSYHYGGIDTSTSLSTISYLGGSGVDAARSLVLRTVPGVISSGNGSGMSVNGAPFNSTVTGLVTTSPRPARLSVTISNLQINTAQTFMNVVLSDSNGNSIKLFDHLNNSNSSLSLTGIIFDDTATTQFSLASAGAVTPGVYRPYQPMALLQSGSASGPWILQVYASCISPPCSIPSITLADWSMNVWSSLGTQSRVAGSTVSTNYPVSQALQTANGGGRDGFFSRFDDLDQPGEESPNGLRAAKFPAMGSDALLLTLEHQNGSPNCNNKNEPRHHNYWGFFPIVGQPNFVGKLCDPVPVDMLNVVGSIFFVSVQTNGLTEGSYGKSSAGIERPVSPVACQPQSLIGSCF